MCPPVVHLTLYEMDSLGYLHWLNTDQLKLSSGLTPDQLELSIALTHAPCMILSLLLPQQHCRLLCS